MENEILQRLREEVKKEKLPELQEMSKEELIKYIENRFQIKDRLIQLVNHIYFAVQQSYFDKMEPDSNYNDFNLLEGSVRHNLETGEYLFTPNDVVKKLLSSVEKQDSTKLKTFLSTRFYKIIEYLYNVEIKGYEKTLKQKEKIPQKVLDLALEEEREILNLRYEKKVKALEQHYEQKLSEKQKEYEDLESIMDILQEELDKYKTQQGNK